MRRVTCTGSAAAWASGIAAAGAAGATLSAARAAAVIGREVGAWESSIVALIGLVASLRSPLGVRDAHECPPRWMSADPPDSPAGVLPERRSGPRMGPAPCSWSAPRSRGISAGGLRPAMTREWPRRMAVGGAGETDHVHGQCHLMPAPRERAIVARSVRAQVKRARFAFTTPPHNVVSVDRSLAAGRSTGDPWLCVPTSRWVCPGQRADQERSCSVPEDSAAIRRSASRTLVRRGPYLRVSARAHHGAAAARRPSIARASWPRWRSPRQPRSGRRRC